METQNEMWEHEKDLALGEVVETPPEPEKPEKPEEQEKPKDE